MDTKANLLYKMDKAKEAIALEEQAISMATEQKNDYKAKEFSGNIKKMKAGEPTCIEQGAIWNEQPSLKESKMIIPE